LICGCTDSFESPEVKRLRNIFNIIENILGSLCVIYYILVRIFCGDIVSLWIWLVIGIALLLKSTACILAREYAGTGIKKVVKLLSDIYDAAFGLFLASFICFLVFVISGMTEKHTDIQLEGCDVCLILGAAVYDETPSPILEKRIDTAYKFLKENENAFAVCTGGIGSKASVSEAECIKRELVKKGISSDRLIIEDKSGTTAENMRFSLKLIPFEYDTIAVITSGFHVSRAKLILSGLTNAHVIGIPSPGGGALLPHYIFREYVVFAVDVICGRYSLFV